MYTCMSQYAQVSPQLSNHPKTEPDDRDLMNNIKKFVIKFSLEVRVGNVTSTTNGPFDNFHAAESTGVVRLLLALKLVKLTVCAARKRVAFEMREVIPLLESFDVVLAKGLGWLCGIARILVELRQALNEQVPCSILGLELIRTPGPGNGDIGFATQVKNSYWLAVVWRWNRIVGAFSDIGDSEGKLQLYRGRVVLVGRDVGESVMLLLSQIYANTLQVVHVWWEGEDDRGAFLLLPCDIAAIGCRSGVCQDRVVARPINATDLGRGVNGRLTQLVLGVLDEHLVEIHVVYTV